VGAMSGATAGVVVETALYPIDTIKTRLQVCIYVLQIVLVWVFFIVRKTGVRVVIDDRHGSKPDVTDRRTVDPVH
jgi:hypothetical protein